MSLPDLEEQAIYHGDRRLGIQRFEWAQVGLGITILVQFAAMVWWGATLTASLGALREATGDYRAAIGGLTATVGNQAARLGILEAKVDDLRDETKEMQQKRR